MAQCPGAAAIGRRSLPVRARSSRAASGAALHLNAGIHDIAKDWALFLSAHPSCVPRKRMTCPVGLPSFLVILFGGTMYLLPTFSCIRFVARSSRSSRPLSGLGIRAVRGECQQKLELLKTGTPPSAAVPWSQRGCPHSSARFFKYVANSALTLMPSRHSISPPLWTTHSAVAGDARAAGRGIA